MQQARPGADGGARAAAAGGRRTLRLPLNYVLPIAAGCLFIAGWQMIVTVYQIPKFLVPSPLLIFETMVNDGGNRSAGNVAPLKKSMGK